MKLDVGMYVRTETGIHKIYRIDNNKTKWKYLYKLKKQDGDGCIDCGVLSSEDILKASYSLLGNDKEPCLIEVGDYVNGEKVKQINCNCLYYDENLGEEVDIPNAMELEKSWIYFESEISSIVTREQFEAMAYKVVK